MKKIITIFSVFAVIYSHAQVGVYSEPVHTKAEFQVANTTNNKGVLIPRMTTAQLLLIPSPATGLWCYSTDNNTFFYYNGTDWQMIGQNCSIVEDNDNDTKIVVDNGSDNDEAKFTSAGTDIFTIDKDGFRQTIGDLIKTAGLITINNSYTLPNVDGTNKDVLVTNGSGTLTWQDPKTLPGLVAGLQSIPLVTGREMQGLVDKAFFTAIIPWSDITVSKISFYVNATGSPVIEVGIYDNLDLLISSSTTIAAAGFQFGTVTLGTPLKLVAGKLYRVGIVDRNRTASTYMENPYYQSPLQWFYTYAGTPQALPDPIPAYTTNQKPIWFCLY